MEVLNVPPEEVLNQSSRRRLFFDSRGNPRCITNSKNRKRKPGTKPLAHILRTNDQHFVDFVSRCLEWVFAGRITAKIGWRIRFECVSFCSGPNRWDPQKRMTPDEAARHQWMQQAASQDKVTHKEYNDNGAPATQPQSQSKPQPKPQPQQQQPQSLHQSSAYKTQKYYTPPSLITSRQLHQTQQIILPDVKPATKHCSNYKLYKDRTKGNWGLRLSMATAST